jgi:hypothetical protein
LNDSVVSGEYPPQKTLFFKDKKKVNVYSLLSGKKVFRHANGTYYRNDYKRVNILCDRYNITKTVSTPDLISLGKDNKWIPQPIDLDKYYFSDIKESKRISHAPTKDKGTDIIKAAIESIGYSPVVISGMSHDKCIELRRSCPFHIDQVSYLGIYGLSSIEAVAIGQINMATLHNVRGYIPNHPFIEINGLTKKQYFFVVTCLIIIIVIITLLF